MKAYLLHLFNVAGGGERVSLEIAYALRSKGLRVVYVTNSSKAMRSVAELLGLPGGYEVIEVGSLIERVLGYTGRFVRLRRLLVLEKGLSRVRSLRGSEEALVIDTGTNYVLDVDVAYVHYPLVLPTYGPRSLYFRMYDWLVKYKASRQRGNPRLVLTNSSWTAGLLWEALKVKAEAVHPPVDVGYFEYDGRPKERVIVTVSRFTPEKSLHLLPEVASRLPDYEWHLVGSLGTSGWELDVGRRVLRRVEKAARERNAKNFRVATDLPRHELRELLRRASFYVHPPFAEHFGISVVEAMAAGCVPIVYRDGGAWYDVVSPIDQGLGYDALNEVPGIIRRLEERPERLERIRQKALEHSRTFRAEVFRERFISTLVKHGLLG